MAGLRPGHPRLPCERPAKTWMPGERRAEATPSYGRLCPGMTKELFLRLRAVIAFDDDEVGVRMRLPDLDVFLVFRRAIAGQRRLVVGEFDHDVTRAAFAFDGGEFAGTHHEAPAEFLEDGRVGRRVSLVAFVIVNVDARNPESFCHFRSPSCCSTCSTQRLRDFRLNGI